MTISMQENRGAGFASAFVAGGYTMYPVLAALVVVGAIVAPAFATAVTLINILEQVSVLGLTTIGLTFVVLIGRLDLSPEGIVGFAPMFALSVWCPPPPAGSASDCPPGWGCSWPWARRV